MKTLAKIVCWPFLMLISIPAILLMWSSALIYGIYAKGARFDEEGVTVCSFLRGKIARYEWGEIESVEIRFVPPFGMPTLNLKSGSSIDLPLANFKRLEAACVSAGVLFSGGVYTAFPDRDKKRSPL